MQNLELKVRCPDEAAFASLIERVQTQAEYRRTLRQRDTYFAVPRGRLKLREFTQNDTSATRVSAEPDLEAAPSGATLVAYTRPDTAGSRQSDYILSPTDNPTELRAALETTLGIRVVVEKVRILYHWGQTRIHLDRVTDLGRFVELETLLDRFPTTTAAQAEHQAVITGLGLDQFPIIAGSYSDLLLAAKNSAGNE